MSEKSIHTEVRPVGEKHFCYLNEKLIGSFNTWLGAHNYIGIKVSEMIQDENKRIGFEEGLARMEEKKLLRPRNQDHEATKAIIEYYKGRNNKDGNQKI